MSSEQSTTAAELSDAELDALADRVAPRLEPGAYGDKMLLTRRQLIGVATGSLSLGALGVFGTEPVRAQSGSWNVGSPSEGAVSVYGDEVRVTQLTLGNNSALIANAASGSVALSSGSATVSTGLGDTGATFYLALGLDDPGADADVAGRLRWDDSAGEYVIVIDEISTSQNPTVNYDVLRVR